MKPSRLTLTISSLLFALTAGFAQTPPAATLSEKPGLPEELREVSWQNRRGAPFCRAIARLGENYVHVN